MNRKLDELNILIEKLRGANISIIENAFDDIAKIIFQNSIISVNNDEFLIREIEFYYYEDKLHEDVFTHKNEIQKQTLKWYFHGAGIDITIGNGNAYGGILIRSILNNNYNEKLIDGPLKTFDKLFDYNSVTEINSIQFRISEKYNYENLQFIKTPRLGLKFKDKIELEKQKQFIVKPYRYIVFEKEHPTLISSKNKNVISVCAKKQLKEEEHIYFVEYKHNQNSIIIDNNWIRKNISEKEIIQLMQQS